MNKSSLFLLSPSTNIFCSYSKLGSYIHTYSDWTSNKNGKNFRICEECQNQIKKDSNLKRKIIFVIKGNTRKEIVLDLVF